MVWRKRYKPSVEEWLGENGLQSFVEWALNNGYEEHLSIDWLILTAHIALKIVGGSHCQKNVSRAHQFNCVMYPRTLPQKKVVLFIKLMYLQL